jgi:hypothetical protein
MKSEKIVRKKRAPVTGTLVGVRLQPPELARLDDWVAKQEDNPTRPEGVRRLMNLGLDGKAAAAKRKAKNGES